MSILSEIAKDEDLLSARSLLRSLMEKLGGPAGVAEEMARDFRACPTGHNNRIKLEMFLLGQLSEHGTDTDELVSKEELESVVKDLMKDD